jgi:hypothetical protein
MVDLVEVKLGNAFCGQTGANLIMDELETDSFWHVDYCTVVFSYWTSSMVWTGTPSMAIWKA